MSCRNNLRQIAIATHNYESANSRLPPAYRSPSPTTAQPYLQWPLLLASELELSTHLNEANEDFQKLRDPFLPMPHRGVSRPIKQFSCPSDPRLLTTWQVIFAYTLAVPTPTVVRPQVALNSYLGNGGKRSPMKDGVIVVDGQLSMISITDGTSNTLMFGERPPSQDAMHSWVYIGWGVHGHGKLDSVIGVLDSNPFSPGFPQFKCGVGPFPYREPDLTSTEDCAVFQYWSLHGGGANFAFADGSVRFLAYSANDILPALASRAGGESVALP
jgi:prepilin-type processing-associated H-X9-DG protein